ncbi:glycoside hydrolase family 2 protein [uncultured Bacteroides sp.]|uniref:glycoside hydrolase family 2 protein n=1 Tax=uncultured Bacteroides sp. TaxID=162156 RepID=UPI0025E2F447|nr:glycoside hydrolase family 2 TIM barrel-domain containing protein [uncultured Bacteroides sp.]
MKTKLKILIVWMLCLTSAALARNVQSFNSGWQFIKGPFATDMVSVNNRWNGGWKEVELPHTYNASDMQVIERNYYEGEAYYRKEYFFPKELKGKRLFLKFEGVGSCADVYVNDRLVGTHKGAYGAFVCEIGTILKPDAKNMIVVKVDNASRPDVIPVNHNLFGVYGGIYRPVWLIVTEQSNISVSDYAAPGVYITQKNVTKKSADVRVKVKLDNATLHPVPLSLENTIYTQEGKKVAIDKQDIRLSPQGTKTYLADFTIKNPHLWQGREDPYLYKVVSRLIQDGKVIDEVVQPLGVRHYEIVAGKGFYLNGEKYPMYGVTRHQDWWKLGSALKKENHDTDLAMIMDIGATTIRLAHYQQADYFYSRCDSLGLMVWAEIPFVNRVTGKERENAHTQLRELIRQSFNHPSIYVWGLHNEVYNPHEYTVSLTRELHDLAKTEDPDRYTVSVNGYGHVEHPVNMNADIQGMNRYFGWYEKKIKDIKPWIEEMEKKYPEQIFMLTEYGAGANVAHQTEYLGETLNSWEPFYPEGYHTKLHEYQWSVIAEHPYIVASYFWNMFDFAVPTRVGGCIPARNMKGMVTFDRKVKKDAYFLYKANWSKDPVLYLTERRNMEREKKNTKVTVYSNLGTPRVYLNGKELTDIKQGYTKIHYIFDNVTLQNGKNILKAIATTSDGKQYEDEIVWNYTGEKVRNIDTYENKNEHFGL